MQFSTIACLTAVYKICIQLRNFTDKSDKVDQLLSAKVFSKLSQPLYFGLWELVGLSRWHKGIVCLVAQISPQNLPSKNKVMTHCSHSSFPFPSLPLYSSLFLRARPIICKRYRYRFSEYQTKTDTDYFLNLNK